MGQTKLRTGKTFLFAAPVLRSVSDVRLRAIAWLFLFPAVASGQELSPLTPLAERVLRLRSELQLDSAQAAKLRDLSRLQAAALTKATAAFLRAEADVVDAGRSDDLVLRRTALEKRSKLAIDGEMLRLRGNRETRAVLTPGQNDRLSVLFATSASDSGVRLRAIWESQVAPLPLSAPLFAVPDSGAARIAVDPLTTEIYVADRLVAYGRLAIRLPVGQHTLKFRTPACIDTVVVTIEKGPPATVAHRMSCIQ